MGTEVAFTCETEGASIYYRTDGAEPDLNDKKWTGNVHRAAGDQPGTI